MKYLGLGALGLAVLLGACSGGDKAEDLAASVDAINSAPVAGETRVAFELADMEGAMRSSDEWNSKPKLINFWATWCAPCRREIPLLKSTQEQHGEGLQVLGIAVDFQEDVVAYAAEAKFNYPILVGQEDAMEVAESSGVPFIGLPFTMVVSPSGELIKTHVGEIVEEHIEQIASVLAEMERGGLDLGGAREKLKNL